MHILSNGQEIWDWSGNVWEWIYGEGENGTIGTTGGFTWNTDSWSEWNIAGLANERSVLGPSDNGWNVAQGMGQYCGGGPTNVFRRGGTWEYGANAGCYALHLSYAPSDTTTYGGFRCCK